MSVIAFDLDDTLMDQLSRLVVWHNRVHGTRLTRRQYVDHSLQSVWHTDDAETSRRAAAFHASEDYHRMVPFPGALKAVRRLRREGHALHVVTGRPSALREPTQVQVEAHFQGLFAELHFCNSYRSEARVSKAVVCRRIGAHLLADDVFDHAKECVEAGLTALLVKHEWNAHVTQLPERMHRIDHVSEVRRFL